MQNFLKVITPPVQKAPLQTENIQPPRLLQHNWPLRLPIILPQNLHRRSSVKNAIMIRLTKL